MSAYERSMAGVWSCLATGGVAALFAIALLASCGDDDSPVSAIPEILTRPGTTWHYEVEIGSVVPDTIDVTLRVFAPGPAEEALEAVAVWQFSSDGNVDTSFVRVHENTLFVVPQTDHGLHPGVETYVFPLAVGEEWRNPDCCDDSSRVEVTETVSVPAGEFTAYRIVRTSTGPNYRLSATTWLDPETGIVRVEKHEYNLGPVDDQTWVLTGIEPGSDGAVGFRRLRF